MKLLARVFALAAVLILSACFNPQVNTNGISLWRDIHSLDQVRTSRFQISRDRLIVPRLDTLWRPTESLRLASDQLSPTQWCSKGGGILRIGKGVSVALSFFKFRGTQKSDTLFIVDGGELQLNDCQISGPAGAVIILRNHAKLKLVNSFVQNAGHVILSDNSEVFSDSLIVNNIHGDAITIGGAVSSSLTNVAIRKVDGVGVTVYDGPATELKRLWVSKTAGAGIYLHNMDRILMDSLFIQDCGQVGLEVRQSSELLGNHLSISNVRQPGMTINEVTSVKLSGLNLTRNSTSGAIITKVDTLSIAASNFSKNALSGLEISQSKIVSISDCQATENGGAGILMRQVGLLNCSRNLFKLNQGEQGGAGLALSRIDSGFVAKNQFAFNLPSGLSVSNSRSVTGSGNVFQQNDSVGGEFVDLSGALALIDNQIIQNPLGFKVSRVPLLIHTGNKYSHNAAGIKSTEVEDLQSRNNQYFLQSGTAVEIQNSSAEFADESFLGNRIGILATDASVQCSYTKISNNTVGMKLNGGSLRLDYTEFQSGDTSIAVQTDKPLLIQNCQFKFSRVAGLVAWSSAPITFTNNLLQEIPTGLKVVHSPKVIISHNRFEKNSTSGIVLSDQTQAGLTFNLFLYNNVVLNLSGGVVTELGNNTYIGNSTVFKESIPSELPVTYSIFQGNHSLGFGDNQRSAINWKLWQYNCFWQNDDLPRQIKAQGAGNFTADPVFQLEYFLKTGSPCLSVGPNNRLVGAKGLTPVIKPE